MKEYDDFEFENEPDGEDDDIYGDVWEDIYGDVWDDMCYECKGHGDDYSIGEDGELVCNCDTCPFCQWASDDD